MNELDGDFQTAYKTAMLDGQLPGEFIVSRAAELRTFYDERAAASPQVKAEGPPGKHDIAYLVQMWINEGVIEESEVVPVVDRLGLTSDEAKVFVSETLPEIREMMAAERLAEREKAMQKQLEAANKYVQLWGLDRLDVIADYFQKNLGKLTSLDQYWGDTIKRYKNGRSRLELELQNLTDPLQQVRILMRELYKLTYLHPSEAEVIFKAENEYGLFVYLDSLLEAAQVMYKTATGKDPDFDKIHIGGTGIGATVSFYDSSNSEHVKRRVREEMMDKLVYGAKNPNETRMPWKKQISRANRRERVSPDG